ncbi:hypothetical protein QN357_01850 [Cryobacterium sp. RTC2.1]|nr:hypothetical protein [Cryobacterium sp. RTC2.1]
MILGVVQQGIVPFGEFGNFFVVDELAIEHRLSFYREPLQCAVIHEHIPASPPVVKPGGNERRNQRSNGHAYKHGWPGIAVHRPVTKQGN